MGTHQEKVFGRTCLLEAFLSSKGGRHTLIIYLKIYGEKTRNCPHSKYCYLFQEV